MCYTIRMKIFGNFNLFGFDLRVIAILLALAVLLGILNNLRQPDEQRVPWFGAAAETVDAEDEQ